MTKVAIFSALLVLGLLGAGVLVVSISYGIGGPIVTLAALSLALNLVLTGAFIWLVKKLLESGQGHPIGMSTEKRSNL